VCCKIAIQDFMTGLHKKNKKNLQFHRRVYRRTITRRYFTESCKTITGLCHNHQRIYRRKITRRYFTDVPYRRNHRRIYAHPEAHACLTRVRLHKYRQSFRRIEKSGEIFKLFLVCISINFQRYYRRNLMPPTTINFRR